MRAKVFAPQRPTSRARALELADARWAPYRLWLLCAIVVAAILAPARPAAAQADEPAPCASICVTVLPEAERDLLKARLASRPGFKQLDQLLAKEGFKSLAATEVALRLDLNAERAAERQLPPTYFTLLLPYGSATSKRGLISAWGDGQSWQIVATPDRKALYTPRAGSPRSISRDEYRGSQPIPLAEIALPASVRLPGSVEQSERVITNEAKGIEASYVASGCKYAYVGLTAWSITGIDIVYRWNQEKSWCFRNGSVTSATPRYWADRIASTMSYHGLSDSDVHWEKRWNYPAKNYCHHSYYQAKFENVVPIWGTIGFEYPWTQLRTMYEGTVYRSSGKL